MSILGWLKRVSGGETAAPLHFTANEQSFAGLDMKAAIEAHNAWKARLEAQIQGNAGESLEVGIVAADHNCALGKWIHNEGQAKFGHSDEFAQLRRAHSEFHLCAGSILADARQGAKDAATASLKTNLRRHSDQVQLTLVRLYARAQASQ